MATMELQRSALFNTAIYLGDDLGDALTYGEDESFEQPVVITRMNGDVENIGSLIQREGEKVHIKVVRETTSQHAEIRVPVTTSPLDVEEIILSLALELLLS